MIRQTTHLSTAYADQIPAQGSIVHLPLSQIFAEKGTKADKRRNESIRLVQNIRKYGLSVPVTVQPIEVFPGAFRYRITEGEELWQAASLAGLAQIPCRIVSASQNDAQVEEILAKIRSKELHFLEQAAALQLLVREYGLTQSVIARGCGLSQSAVANKLRLMQLNDAERQTIRQKGLTERHARALLRLCEPQKRALVLDCVLRGTLTVSGTESLVEAVLLGEKGIPDVSDRGNGANEVEMAGFEGRTGAYDRPKSDFELVDSAPQESPDTFLVGEVRPRRFILHTLQPLYNSLERTLAIFRKTGKKAYLRTEERAEEVLITIRIPAER